MTQIGLNRECTRIDAKSGQLKEPRGHCSKIGMFIVPVS
jgi:hypothetical protein